MRFPGLRALRRTGAVFLTALLAACGANTAVTTRSAEPVADVRITPAARAGADPVAPVAVEVSSGRIYQVALTNANGKQVRGEFTDDHSSYRAVEPLAYGTTYTWTGTAVGTDGIPVPIDRTFTTFAPDTIVGATVNIADHAEVGISEPIVVQFDRPVADRAAVERALSVTATPETEGSWAWLPGDSRSRVCWRPREYWQPGTEVHVAADFYGLDLGGGAYGAADLTSDFRIARGLPLVPAEPDGSSEWTVDWRTWQSMSALNHHIVDDPAAPPR